jgi:metal-responsive CopG/Arc/MetJ family transcriptional regulator
MDAQRKRINMRLPENLLNAIDNFCERSELARTTYFEMLARSDLKRRSIKFEKPKQPFIWHGAIEDMPLQIPE